MPKTETLKGGALVLAAIAACYTSHAQTNAAAPAAPSAGLANDYLRTQSDTFKDWDLGGQVRARYEIKDHFAVPGNPIPGPGVPTSLDFREHGGVAHNYYLLLREKVH